MVPGGEYDTPPEVAETDTESGIDDLEQESRDAQDQVEAEYEMRRQKRGAGQPPKLPKPKLPGGRKRRVV